MIQFIYDFIGGSDYPFIAYSMATILSAVVLFMFYSIIASLFRWR